MKPILPILRRGRIEFVEQGPNVASGNVNVHCPLCGDADPSHHLGIKLSNGWWGCWRNARHRGKDILRLYSLLFKISYSEAEELFGDRSGTIIDPRSLTNIVKSLKGGTKVTDDSVKAIKVPFKRIKKEWISKRFWYYLENRGFKEEDIKKVIRRYNLRYSVHGKFAYRIIFPVYLYDKIVGWTGRDITGNAVVRYKSLPNKEKNGYPQLAPVNIKETIFNHQNLKGGKALFIVEGPFDAIKLDFYGRRRGYNATALYSTNITDAQVSLLCECSKLYEKKYLLLDSGTTVQTIDILPRLSMIDIAVAKLPDGIKDPGEMVKKEVKNFLRSY